MCDNREGSIAVKRTFSSSTGLLSLAVFFVAGCGEPEQIRTYTVEKLADWRPRIVIEEPQPAPQQAPAKQPGKLNYDTPAGWQTAANVMFADVSLAVTDGNETAKITVSPMGIAQSALVPNVNRWRRQLGLTPISQAEIEKSLVEIKVGDATAKFFEFIGPESAGRSETILAAMLPQNGRMLIVKLKGESKLAKREKENFLSFLRSLD